MSRFPHFLVQVFLILTTRFRDQQISDQMDILNEDYKGTGLSFRLDSIVRVLNPDWFDNVAPDNDLQTEMKSTYRQGDEKTLNVYTVGFNNDDARGLLGYATFPDDYEGNPNDDGVVLLHSTLPQGSSAPYNLGRTLTHEAGHWVGLYHPFQGGCEGDNDYVADTPAEAYPASGCPGVRDTCPSMGDDRMYNFALPLSHLVSHPLPFKAVQNFMDYADDECMLNFTPGQVDRFKDQLRVYRGIDLD